jgi:hypothetical protein
MTHSTVIASCFCGAQSLLVGDISFVWWVQVCRNDACHQRSLLYFSLIHIYYRIYFLVIPLLSRLTRYSWNYGHLIFSSRENGGAKVCDAESLLSLLSLLCFSLIRVPHSIRSLTIPLLCRGSMYSFSCARPRTKATHMRATVSFSTINTFLSWCRTTVTESLFYVEPTGTQGKCQ